MLSSDELSRAWDLYADRLLLIIRGFGEPADDAMQEAFVKLAQLNQMPDEPMAWLVKVARNQLLQWWRSNARSRRRVESRNGVLDWFTNYDLETQFDAREATSRLQALPLEQREPVMMHIWGGMSFEQIGEVLGISRSTAHRQYMAALKELRSRFACSIESENHEP